MKSHLLLLATVLAVAVSASAVDPTWVTVGDPGEGGVAETFSMSKFEVTNEQYAEFLNAVARASDPNGLYSVAMSDPLEPSIIRSGSGGNYTYKAVSSYAKNPVNWVRADDARRFCNWLQNGKGKGSTETGAYTMTGNSAPSRNPEAVVWLPNQEEWEKAAFYSPVKPGGAGFYNYATQSDVRPISTDIPTTSTNAANHYWDDTLDSNQINGGYALVNSTTGFPGLYLCKVGSYPNSRSYYGTLDQGGNVSELLEFPGELTTFIGGSFGGIPGTSLDTLFRNYGTRFWINDVETLETGFRIAAVGPLAADTDPVSLIVPVGDPAAFSASVTGVGATMQWRKGGVNIAGASFPGPASNYNIAAAKLTDAGAYSVRSTNIVSAVTSASANLVVVDTTTTVKHVHKATQTASLTASASGAILSYLWKKDDGDIVVDVPGRITGITSKTLTIKQITDADKGVYTCEVEGAAGKLTSAAQTIYVVDTPPVITDGQTLDDAMVGGDYPSAFIVVDPGDNQVAAKFTATGLPPGMKINSVTGELYGYPTTALTVAKVYTVKITATNPIGSDKADIFLTVQPIPTGAVGKFVGTIEREVTLNQELGGRLEITSTTAGAYSGKAIMGGKSYSFKGGRLNMNVGVNNPKVIEIKRSGLTPLTLEWTVDPATNLIKGTLKDDALNEAGFVGWRNKWNSKSTDPAVFGEKFMGYHTMQLAMTTVGPLYPEGAGFATFTVAKGGTLKVVGKLPDNTSFTVSTFVGPEGQIAIFQSLYKNLGSILSSTVDPDPTVDPDLMKITSGGVAPTYVDNSVGGKIHWLKKQQAATVKNYPDAFQDTMTVAGLKYNKVDAAVNALGADVTTAAYTFEFTGANLGAASRTPNADFSLSDKHKMLVPNPPVMPPFAGTTLSLNKGTGQFTGKFTLLDGGVPRTLTYQGVVVRNSVGVGIGYGYVMVPQLPTPSTSLQLSGLVRLGDL